MTNAPGAFSSLDEDGINVAVEEALAAFTATGILIELKEIRLAHVSGASPLTLANQFIGTSDKVDRPVAGKLLGNARGHTAKALTAKQEILEAAAKEEILRTEAVNVTIPTSHAQAGARYLPDVLIDEACDLLTSVDWPIAKGPGIEHEWFDFGALNFDADHSARQIQNAFCIDDASVGTAEGQAANLVLHIHISLVQAHVMLKQQPPFYVACPGKVFRSDELDTTHTPVFYQVGSLTMNKDLTMAHLKGVLDYFAKAMFDPEACTRLRSSFLPFAESSAEIGLWSPQKKGGADWIEQGGCGMVSPNVLTACGIDPKAYTDFAFGMGLERTPMLRHRIADMHDIVEGDIRFSQQFGAAGKGD